DGTGHRPCDGGVAARPGAPRRPGLPDRGAGRARRRRGGARGRPGGRAAGRPGGDRVTLSAALILPWATGVPLVLLAVLMAGVLADGSRDVVTGRWPEGVGIVLRADTLGVAFALLSVLVLLAATAHEVIAGVRDRTFPGLVLLLAGGLTGLFLTGDMFNFYVFFELAMTASYALSTYGGGRRQLRAALIFTAVNLLGSFIFLLSVAGTYRTTGTLAMQDVAER